MGPVLVEDVVDVDKQRPQILNLAFCVGGVSRQRAGELEEVEEQRLDELLEFECAVVVLCVLGVGEACGGQVGDALLFEGGQFIVQLHGEPVSARRSMRGVATTIPCTGRQRLAIVRPMAPGAVVGSSTLLASRGCGQRARKHGRWRLRQMRSVARRSALLCPV